MTLKPATSRNSAGLRKRQRLRALFLNLTFYPLMALWIIAGILVSPLLLLVWRVATGWEIDRIVRHFIWIHGRGLIAIVSPFVALAREGVDEIKRPCILVVNHLSFFDGYYMAALPFHDITFAVGAWPFRMYWYTMFMRLGRYLDVENIGWDEALRTARRAFAKGGVVLFFPEGHRSRTGRLQQFHSGAFRLAAETGVPVVPLCITGTDVLLPPGHYRLHPAMVRLRALATVDPASFPGSSGHIRMRRHVREIMAKTLHEMQAEPVE